MKSNPVLSIDAAPDSLDPELERRISALEAGPDAGSDFDAVSWFWLIVLGIVTPAALLLWAWFG